MGIEDDIGAIFDGGSGDDELDRLRLQHPLYVISHNRREGWFAHPTWCETTDHDLMTVTAAELSRQMARQAAEYRTNLTRSPDGWS